MPSFSETLSALNVVQVAGGSKSLFAGVCVYQCQNKMPISVPISKKKKNFYSEKIHQKSNVHLSLPVLQ